MVGHLIDFLYLGEFLRGYLMGEHLANLLAQIYIVADKYMVHRLKKHVVQHLRHDRCLPSLFEDRFLEVSEFIYRNTSDSNAPFRELFTNLACVRFKDFVFYYWAREYLSSTTTFVEDLFEAQHRASMMFFERW